MEKNIGDLTLNEIINICKNNECYYGCPLVNMDCINIFGVCPCDLKIDTGIKINVK